MPKISELPIISPPDMYDIVPCVASATNDTSQTTIADLVAAGLAAAPAGTYTPTNVTTDRSYDADATSTAELADVLGTLIADLQSRGIIG